MCMDKRTAAGESLNNLAFAFSIQFQSASYRFQKLKSASKFTGVLLASVPVVVDTRDRPRLMTCHHMRCANLPTLTVHAKSLDEAMSKPKTQTNACQKDRPQCLRLSER